MKNKDAEEIAELANRMKKDNAYAAICLLNISSALCDGSINELMELMNVHADRRHKINIAMAIAQNKQPNLN